MMSVGELEKFYHLSRQNIQSREQKDALIEQRELLEERIARAPGSPLNAGLPHRGVRRPPRVTC